MSVPTDRQANSRANQRAAMFGLAVNVSLVGIKLVAGILGNAYALIADAVESSMDVFGSLVVWFGLSITNRPADEDYPYGYGRAEPLAVATVALMLLGAAAGVAVAAIREILTPHHMPEPFTLVVLVGVVVFKETLFRRVSGVAESTGSKLVESDAWHHRSDALTSAAAFVGILIALWFGPGWEAADDWAALVASAIIAWNGVRFLRLAVQTLMDRQPEPTVLSAMTAAAEEVTGVLASEKLRVRAMGDEWFADIHIQAEPTLSLEAAHVLSGKVKSAIRLAVPQVRDVLVHMEPHYPP